jgi:hypothetical protein
MYISVVPDFSESEYRKSDCRVSSKLHILNEVRTQRSQVKLDYFTLTGGITTVSQQWPVIAMDERTGVVSGRALWRPELIDKLVEGALIRGSLPSSVELGIIEEERMVNVVGKVV